LTSEEARTTRDGVRSRSLSNVESWNKTRFICFFIHLSECEFTVTEANCGH